MPLHCLSVALIAASRSSAAPAAVALIASIWFHALVLPAALLICALMLGALAMHVRIHDPLRKSAPAAGMLALAALIVVGSLHG